MLDTKEQSVRVKKILALKNVGKGDLKMNQRKHTPLYVRDTKQN